MTCEYCETSNIRRAVSFLDFDTVIIMQGMVHVLYLTE